MTRAANGKRGEVSLTLDGKDYVLRPSFEAILEIEDATGKGLVEIVRAALQQRLTISEIGTVTAALMRAWGREVDDLGAKAASADKVARLIFECDNGAAAVQAAIAQLLTIAAGGGVTASGEVKAATRKKATPAAA